MSVSPGEFQFSYFFLSQLSGVVEREREFYQEVEFIINSLIVITFVVQRLRDRSNLAGVLRSEPVQNESERQGNVRVLGRFGRRKDRTSKPQDLLIKSLQRE